MIPFGSHDINKLKITNFGCQNDEGMLTGSCQKNNYMFTHCLTLNQKSRARAYLNYKTARA